VYGKNAEGGLSSQVSSVTEASSVAVSQKRKMHDWVVRLLTVDEQKQFDRALALYFYSCGIPFNKVAHESLLKALQILRPNVTLPNRNKLGGELLDECYNNVRARVSGVLAKAGFICMTSDAWTSILGMSVINFIAVTPKGTYFTKCIHSGTMSHSAENMRNCIDEQIVDLGGYTRVAGLCTDNTKVNKAVWKDFEEAHRGFFAYGCICHGLHLLVGDLIEKQEWFSELAEGMTSVVKVFKKSGLLWAELRAAQIIQGLRMLALMGETRWGSLLKSMQTGVQSAPVLLDIVCKEVSGRAWYNLPGLAAKTKKKRKLVYDIITKPDWCTQLRKGIKVLELICRYIVEFQGMVRTAQL
jgi:hypothetical protein